MTEKSNHSFQVILTWGLLGLIVLATIVLSFLNGRLSDRQSTLNAEIATLNAEIELLASRSDIKRAEIISKSAADIEKEIRLHRIDKVIEAVEAIEKQSGLNFRWFSYANGQVTTAATSNNSVVGVSSIDRIISFLRTYRSQSVPAPYNLFDLAPVWSLAGNAQERGFGIGWTIYPEVMLSLTESGAVTQ